MTNKYVGLEQYKRGIDSIKEYIDKSIPHVKIQELITIPADKVLEIHNSNNHVMEFDKPSDIDLNCSFVVNYNNTSLNCVVKNGDPKTIEVDFNDYIDAIFVPGYDINHNVNENKMVVCINLNSNTSPTDLVLKQIDANYLKNKCLKDDVAIKNSITIGTRNAENDIGLYSFSNGRLNTAGPNSHAEGLRCTASGVDSHAEGYRATALGENSHAEGNSTEASGNASHAEGEYTAASGNASHAEGSNTIASGYNSHAEGSGTIAKGDNSHTQGKYNIEDTNNKYAHIVGNGTYSARSNAHTLDWNGNAWYAGKLSQEGTPTEDKDLTNKKYVDDRVAGLVNSAPETLDTLKELSTALGDDPNFATTMTTALGNKVDKVDGKVLSTNDLTNELKANYDAAYAHSQSEHFDGDYNSLANAPNIPNINGGTAGQVLAKASNNDNDVQWVDMPDSSNFLSKVDKNVHYESSNLTYSNPDLLDDYYQLNNFGSYVFNKTWDLKMSSNSTLEPYYIDLIKDGKVQFTLTPDKFSFNETHLYYEADTVIRDGIHYKIYASNYHVASDGAITNKIIVSWEACGVSYDAIRIYTANNNQEKIDVAYAYSQATHSYNNLTDKPTIPSVTNDLTNALKANYDAAYAHSQSAHAPSNAQKNSDITKAEIEAKLTGNVTTHTHSQYLTEHQDISNLALKSELHTHTNKAILDAITSDKINSWDSKSTFSGSYKDLADKPTIPSVEGLATESYVDSKFLSEEIIFEGQSNDPLVLHDYYTHVPIANGMGFWVINKTIEINSSNNPYVIEISGSQGKDGVYGPNVSTFNSTYNMWVYDLGNGDKLQMGNIEYNGSPALAVAWDTAGSYSNLKITKKIDLMNTINSKVDKAYVDGKVSDLVNSSPEALDTLKELADALGNDPNFATTVSNQIGNKVDKVSGKGLSTNDLTSTLKANYDAAYTHSKSAHAPSNAQKNSDITKAEIEAKLTGNITTHTHSQYLTSIPSEYITEQELTSKGYITEDVLTSKGYITEDVLTSKGYATESQINSAVEAAATTNEEVKTTVNQILGGVYIE